jgi:hypothetical protein
MPRTIWGQGRYRRDDTLNRVLDTFLKGQVVPLGGSYNPDIQQALFSQAGATIPVTSIDLGSPDGSIAGLIVCGISKAGSHDTCG